MPAHLRPQAPIAADAILVGDPGRALLLAQELLERPKMSNHARGLWGYSGRLPGGAELTIQATGMGAPSAIAVLADLAELGVRRAVRVGSCTALGAETGLGELLAVSEAIAAGGSSSAFGISPGATVAPDPGLRDGLEAALAGSDRSVRIVSVDAMPARDAAPGPELAVEAEAADLQTAAVLARGRQLGIAAAALLVVAETAAGEGLPEEALEAAAKRAGRIASQVFSP